MKKVSVVGRWLLGVPCALICLGLSRPAQAGWSFTQETDGSAYASHEDPTTRDWGFFNPVAADSTRSDAPNASAKTSGSITLVCKWTPEDANDQLPAAFFLVVSSQAEAYVHADLAGNPRFHASVGAGQQSPVGAGIIVNNGLQPVGAIDHTTQVFGGGNSGVQNDTWKREGIQLFLKKADSVVAAADGSRTWRIQLDVRAEATGSGQNGSVRASVGASASAELPVFSPDPNHLALYDGVTTKPLNQYVITEGISTGISSQNADVVDWLLTHANWRLIGTAPPLLPISSVIASNSVVFPVHTVPSYQAGMKFDIGDPATASSTSNVGWSFPTNNAPFGEKTFNHILNTSTTIPAQVALFFPWNGFQHPTGGPKMIDGTTDGVPNYIYYYSKAYPAPWGTEVRFWNEDSSAQGGSFIVTGTDSHGVSHSYLYGSLYNGPDTDGGIDTDLFGMNPTNQRLIWVGHQRIRGLDLYARNVYHECVHKRLYEAIHDLHAPDSEVDPITGLSTADGLPDSIEEQIGTDSMKTNSIPWGTPYMATDGSDISDNETFCRMCERDLPVPDDDWADDGFNFGQPAAPNRITRFTEFYYSGFNRNNVQWIDARALVP